jgi:predicted secreted hydrolase
VRRRECLGATLGAAALGVGALGAGALPRTTAAGEARGDPPQGRFARVEPGRPLVFPRDFGAHPAYRTEWWYLTGWLTGGARTFGVQITFFRARTTHAEDNPSRFAPRQLLLAHAALAVPEEGRLRHDQRAARTGFGLAQASETDTDLALGTWRLRRLPDDTYATRIEARDFGLDLRFTPRGAPFPQGEAGYSRKGPRPEQASHYYSRPQLAVSGRVRLDAGRGSTGAATQVQGVAWLDHEWSSELLDPRAAGWDWVGLNLDDGSALMAFRIRTRDGATLWSHARWLGLPASGPADPQDSANAPRFEPRRTWRSPRSGATYPTAMRLAVGARVFDLEPLFDDQELDTRASTGTLYWEGAVRVLEAGRSVGRGYLELTGYAGPLRL